MGLWLDGLVISPDGRQAIRDQIEGPAEAAEELGRALAERLRSQGAIRILEEAG